MSSAGPSAAPPPVALARTVLRDPAIWVTVLLGLTLRLAVGLHVNGHVFVSDEAEYYAVARVLADGRGFSYYDDAPWLRPPAYPALLATAMRLEGESADLARWLQVAMSLLLGPLSAWLALLTDGRRRVALITSALTLLLLPLAVMPWLLLTETVFTLLALLAAIGLAARWRGGGLGWTLLVGAALGGACLVRGFALGWLGLAVVGLALAGHASRRRRFVHAGLALAVAALLVAPWTARNYVAYHGLLPLETTAAYNLWLRAQGGRGQSWMLDELDEQPDPLARQSHALQRGLALIAADPTAYLARVPVEVADVFRNNFSAPERFVAGFAVGDVPVWWLAALLLLDDVLGMLVVALAVVGLWQRAGPLRWLVGGALGWTLVTAAVFFAISRFRVPLLPLLALAAAVGLVDAAVWWRRVPTGGWRPLALLPTMVYLTALAGSGFDGAAYAQGWASQRLGAAVADAETVRAAGDPQRALELMVGQPRSTTAALVAALALADLRQTAAAESVLPLPVAEPRALIVGGEIRRQAGDLAGAARHWSTREVDEPSVLAWAWQRVNVATTQLGVGDGLDVGLVHGVYADEREGGTAYRWTDGRGRFRLQSDGRCTLQARLRAFRPNGQSVPLQAMVDGPVGSPVAVGAEWQTYDFGGLPAGAVVVELVSPTVVLGYKDSRKLGVMVDWVACAAPARGSGWRRGGDESMASETNTAAQDETLDAELLEVLACPVCKQAIRQEGNRLICTACARRYPIEDGIPIMLIERAELPG